MNFMKFFIIFKNSSRFCAFDRSQDARYKRQDKNGNLFSQHIFAFFSVEFHDIFGISVVSELCTICEDASDKI